MDLRNSLKLNLAKNSRYTVCSVICRRGHNTTPIIINVWKFQCVLSALFKLFIVHRLCNYDMIVCTGALVHGYFTPCYSSYFNTITCVCSACVYAFKLISSSPGTTTRRFVGHKKDVLSVAFSADNRQIVSASRDKTIKLWNTLGVCKYTIQVSIVYY